MSADLEVTLSVVDNAESGTLSAGEYGAEIAREFAEKAEASATSAEESRKIAEAWAISDNAPMGEGTRSSKTWADVSRQWAESDNAPDNITGAKSSKKWSEVSHDYAEQSAASASASAKSATASANSAMASASSASASAKSAANAKASEDKAKASENAAKASELAAKASEESAADALYKLEHVDLPKKADLASPSFTGTPKVPTAASGTNTTQAASTAFVQAAIDTKLAASDAMLFKGTLGTGGTITALPASHSTGDTYKVITKGTYAGAACEAGDMVVCLKNGTAANNADWTIIQGNIDGAVTGPASAVDGRIAVFSGATGKVIKDSGYTIATSVPANAKFTDTTYTAGTNISISSQKISFSGTLPPASGGTGQTTLESSANALINALTVGSDTPRDDDYIVVQYAGGGTSNTAYRRKSLTKLSDYMHNKLKANWIKSLSINGKAITITKGNDSTSTITTQDTTYANATASAAGLMSAADKGKLDSIASGSTKTIIDSELSNISTNPVQNKAIYAALAGKAAASHTHSYLPLSGGTLTGNVNTSAQLISAGKSSSWVSGRSNAVLRMNGVSSSSAYMPVISAKTYEGSWDIGTFSGNKLYFSYITDTNFNAGTNSQTAYVTVSPNGDVTTTGRIMNAYYNDYAEFFPRGGETEPGDIVALSNAGDDTYVRATDKSALVVGVHSDDYALCIGAEPDENGEFNDEEINKKFIPVALAGRVYVKFMGVAKAGMRVVPSHIPGVGRAFGEGDSLDAVVGRIVKADSEQGIRLVKIMVRR